jgi:hypothetical protein
LRPVWGSSVLENGTNRNKLQARGKGDPPAHLLKRVGEFREALIEALPTLVLDREGADAAVAAAMASPPLDVVEKERWAEKARLDLAAAAEAAGWPKDELFAVPPVWARDDLRGVGLSLGDSEVTEVTPTRIGIRTASGAPQAFYRRPQPDYAVAYKAHLALNRHETEAGNEEARLRAIERVVGLYRQHHPNCTIDEAKVAVLQALAQLKENN